MGQEFADTPSIGEYLRRTSRLLDDLNCAIHDLLFQKDGGEIIWASDFTEINAFVLPEDVDQLRSTTETALDIATLERFFFGPDGSSRYPVVLLPPHRVELRNAEGFFQQKAVREFQELTHKAAVEIRELQIDQKFTELLVALDRKIPRRRREALNAELLGHLNKHAGALFLTITQTQRTPQGRLRELLQRAQLVDISSAAVYDGMIPPSELEDSLVRDLTAAIYTRRVERAKARKRGPKPDELDHLYRNSLRDALAVAYLSFVNDRIQSKRLILLTRSEFLISEVRSYAETIGNPRLANYVRRATAYRQSILGQQVTVRQRIAELRQRRRGLELARKALRHPIGEALGIDDERRASIEQQITKLNELWRESANLSVATLSWTPHTEPLFSSDDVPNLLDILRNKDRLNKIVQVAATRLAADINVNNALLGYFDGERTDRPVESFVERPSEDAQRRRVLVWSKDTLSTIALYFYDDIVVGGGNEKQDGSRILRRLLNARLQLDSEDLGDGRQGTDPVGVPRLVESCLASSYLEAIDEHWGTALTFAEMAVNWPVHLDRTPRHEALYMRAVVRRRYEEPTLESLEMCIQDVNAAAIELGKVFGAKEDPRYLLQMGICHFGIWEHVDGGRMADVNAPTLDVNQPRNDSHYQQAKLLFERARHLIEEQGNGSESAKRLLVDVANARCYAHVSAHGGDETSLRLYSDLTRAVRDCGWDNHTVPISQLDTLVWAMFMLRDRIESINAVKDAATILAQRLPNYHRGEQDKAIVKAHLQQIEATLGIRFVPIDPDI